ncbi:hypothetical protein NCCP2145_14190 [Pseudarthrobacter sp. NCCP-2145]|nr:hypothetical protein NCCP2145_14190 [Pseudarthrobacter sp. NCCP-2145]
MKVHVGTATASMTLSQVRSPPPMPCNVPYDLTNPSFGPTTLRHAAPALAKPVMRPTTLRMGPITISQIQARDLFDACGMVLDMLPP